ncbi:MAG: antibiotic biosynthesis monooxygenase [Bacteroidota bacterium]|nr:antibiotic biosynthesis monooxygenase [Bacteroidota bacterium]
MTFKSDSVERFKDIFNASKSLISAMEGCRHVELLQDINNPCIFFTLSIWDEPEYLENYRKSELFSGVWAKTKILFDDKPEAWSLYEM